MGIIRPCRLLDLSEGTPDSQAISLQQPPPLSDPKDKKCPSDEEFLLTKLDTENVEQDITDEVGSLFSNQPEILNEVQRSNNSRYNLRRSPRPSVRLNSTKLESPPDIKSILKPIDDLLILDNSQIRAIKKAIRLHKSEDYA